MTDINRMIELTNEYLNELPSFPGAVAAEGSVSRFIDHTLLKPEATPDQITQLCKEAVENQFASVCINPIYVSQCANLLAGSGVKVCTVVGFPLGAIPTALKVGETLMCMQMGAEEIDMVIPIGLLKAAKYSLVFEDIRQVVAAAHGGKAIVKVIIETVLLGRRDKIAACLISKEAGADFVKTSTGFAGGGATVEDVELMRRVVGPVDQMGVKAAGGVRSLADALAMLHAGATRLGTSSGGKIVQEKVQAK
jgi:deoxyribose-phosphate aldolase